MTEPVPSLLIRRAAVLGAGTMGSRIAAHLANAGIPVLLLDLVPEGAKPKSQLAIKAIEALLKSKPAAFYDPSFAARVTPGNFDDDLPKLATCDWVIEAVAENLAIKQSLLERVIPNLAPQAILTTNTSGLPIAQIAAILPESLRSRFLGAHFFNPPRYMRLLEIIPTPATDPALAASLAAFADLHLGKQPVFSNDTPNFIANRIGVAVLSAAVRLMLEQNLTIEEVDALTGPALGWPRTGTFRLADMVGIDVLAHIAANFPKDDPNSGQSTLAPLFQELVTRKWLGDKTGQGFYKKSGDQRQTLDLATWEYRPQSKPNLPSLDMAKNAKTLPERLRLLLAADPAKDKASRFLWPLLSTLWNLSATLIGDAAHDAPSIDAAMRAGYNWELGPFEMWDAAGLPETVARMKALNLPVPAAAEAILRSENTSWYAPDGPQVFNPISSTWEPLPTQPGHATAADFRRSHKIIRENPACSLIDLGDNVALIELHTLKNALGTDATSFIAQVLQPDSDPVRNFSAFVISGDRDHFSVGANLMQLLLAAQEADWDEVAQAIRGFQRMTSAIKFCPRPVVAAPFGMTLGGGAEINLHAAKRQPHAETYIGLVEAGVGLIPAGGGTKEMLLRALAAASTVAPPDPKDPPSKLAQSAEVEDAVKRALEIIATAKVSTSAFDARTLGLIAPADGITLNRGRLLLDAKTRAMALAESGYAAPIPRTNIPAPGQGVLASLQQGIFLMGEAGYASEHDQKVARWAANILCGGRLTPGAPITEQYLLDLELEAFLSLTGERKTQERIAHTLKTGKPLRN